MPLTVAQISAPAFCASMIALTCIDRQGVVERPLVVFLVVKKTQKNSVQVESTMAMQAIQPKVKAIQERNKGKPNEETQMEVARLYQEAKVNPLAGCLPTLATLPVWIGLYRCVPAVGWLSMLLPEHLAHIETG